MSLYDNSDTLHSIFGCSLELPIGSIHSLFLTNTLVQPDSLFTTDIPPYHPTTDSSIGIRFVNLSTGSGPVSVDIQGQPNGSEVISLPYKGITDFKNYSARATISSYKFEFKNAASGAILATYTMSGVNNGVVNSSQNQLRFRNFTIVLKGLPGATSVFLVNNSF